MPFAFRLYEPEADVAFLSVVDGEALFNCDDKLGHDARDATLQQIGWHPVRFPEAWFLADQHQATANRVLETLQCTIQYLHHCQRKAEKELRKATKTLTRYQEERDDAFEELVTLRETLALYKKRVALADAAQSSSHRQPDPRSRVDGLVCSLCGNEYPSVHSLQSHIQKRHKRAEEFASLAATSAGVARRRAHHNTDALGADGLGDVGLYRNRAATDGRSADNGQNGTLVPSRLVDSLTSEVSALRLQVAKLMGEAADQRKAFSPVHLVGMPLGMLPGQAPPCADLVQRSRPRDTASAESTEVYMKGVTEALQQATEKMAAMEKTIAALQQGAHRPSSSAPETQGVAPSSLEVPPNTTAPQARQPGILGALPSSAAAGERTRVATRAGDEAGARPLLLSPNLLAQRRHGSVATTDWDVDVSPMTQADPTPRGSVGTRPGSVRASHTSPEDIVRHDSALGHRHRGTSTSQSATGTVKAATLRTVSTVSSSRDEPDSKAVGAEPPLDARPDSREADTSVDVEDDHSGVLLTARRPATGSALSPVIPPVAPPLPLSTAVAIAVVPKDRYTLSPGDALSTTVTPRETGRSHTQFPASGGGVDDASPRPSSSAGSDGGQMTRPATTAPLSKRSAEMHTTTQHTPRQGRRESKDDGSSLQAGSTTASAAGESIDIGTRGGASLAVPAASSPHSLPSLSLPPTADGGFGAGSPEETPSPYSIPSVLSPGSLVHIPRSKESALPAPKVELVAQPSKGDIESSFSALSYSNRFATPGASPTAPPPLHLGGRSSAEAAAVVSATATAAAPTARGYVDSLPQSMTKRTAHPESPLGWKSSDDESEDVDGDEVSHRRRNAPPPLGTTTPLHPPYLMSSEGAATLPTGKLPKMTMLEGRSSSSGDRTAERPAAGAASTEHSGHKVGGSSSYSYYYTYPSATPSDEHTGRDGAVGRPLPPTAGVAAEIDDASPAQHSASEAGSERLPQGSSSKRHRTADLPRTEGVSHALDLPPNGDHRTGKGKVKGMFKSLFPLKKKKKDK